MAIRHRASTSRGFFALAIYSHLRIGTACTVVLGPLERLTYSRTARRLCAVSRLQQALHINYYTISKLIRYLQRRGSEH